MQNRLHDFIIAARRWPDHHKKIFSVAASGAITLVIAAGWASTLPGQFSANAASISPVNQTAAASLSIIATTTATQGSNTTASLQSTLNQGAQIFSSLKSDFSNIFSGSASAQNSTNPPSSAVTITNTPQQQQVTQNSNPYTNLKYYVSNGVLITSPSSNNSGISVGN